MKTIAQLQEFLGLKPDGLWGPKSQAAFDAIFAAKLVESEIPREPVDGTSHMIDERSLRNIGTLLPPVRELAKRHIEECAKQGIFIQITSGSRTYAEQDALYAQGNVTKARGGYSNHNFGLAYDVTIDALPDPKLQPVWESPLYKKIGAIGKSLGLSWGGDWHSIVDEPHFELRPTWTRDMSEGAMITELRRRKAAGEDIF